MFCSIRCYCNSHWQGDKGPRFTRTFGNMGFFKPPRLPFEERPKLVTQNDLEQFKQQAGASLLALSRLQELDLSACSKLTDSSITQVEEWRAAGCFSLEQENVKMLCFLHLSGGAIPRPPPPVSLHAARDHRRQLGITSLALPQSHQPGAQPLPGRQWPWSGPGCTVPPQAATSLPLVL